MVKREKPVNWEQYYEAKWRQQMDEEIFTAVARTTPRELYEQSSLTGTARYLVNRPCTYALHGTQVNYPVAPQKIMRNVLIDGWTVVKIGDPENIKIQEHVWEVRYDRSSSILDYVRIQYQVEESPGQIDSRKMWYREDWHRWWNGTAWIGYVEIFKVVLNEKDFEVVFTYEFPFWPFVAFRWVDDESIIEPVKFSVIRLEGVSLQVEGENTRHSGRKLFIIGIRKGENRLTPREISERINYLPENCEAYYVDSDTGGVGLMFEEQEKLDAYIERTTSVISIRQLAGLSGESRQIAEQPLVMLAEDIRMQFELGMEQIVVTCQEFFGKNNTYMQMKSPDLVIDHRFLRMVFDKKDYLEIVNHAVQRQAITPDEERTELRRLLQLQKTNPALPPPPEVKTSENEETKDV